jgi:hypothetical protein
MLLEEFRWAKYHNAARFFGTVGHIKYVSVLDRCFELRYINTKGSRKQNADTGKSRRLLLVSGGMSLALFDIFFFVCSCSAPHSTDQCRRSLETKALIIARDGWLRSTLRIVSTAHGVCALAKGTLASFFVMFLLSWLA